LERLTSLPHFCLISKKTGQIKSAKVPDNFTHKFLQNTIGLKGTNDRPFIPLLRTLGFIDQSGAPTAAYRDLKSNDHAKSALADALRRTYAPLFEADEKAHMLTGEKLKNLVGQVSGTDADMTTRIAASFGALVKLADFSAVPPKKEQHEKENQERVDTSERERNGNKSLRPEFHYNIQVHLPSNATEEVYLSIFNALRKSFQ
jgi:hypothetical protein